MTTGEITAFVLFALGLTAATAFQTLARLNFPQLTALPKEAAVESIVDVADDVLIEGIEEKVEVLCALSGVPLPGGAAPLIDFMLNSGEGHEHIVYCYNDILALGLRSSSYAYAMDVLNFLQQEQLALLF